MANAHKQKDAYIEPSMPLTNRLARALWRIFYLLLFRSSPRPFHVWRAMVLRLFGAKLGENCHIYPGAIIWAPWNLECEDLVAIADGATIYNPKTIKIKSHATISQDAYLCGATHDYDDPAFPMISDTITIERYAWVCARATVLMGVTIGEGAVLALGSVAAKDIEAWSVCAGIPARKVKNRKRHEFD